MKSPACDNKKIAINTILLYLRMVVTLLISLYTSRAILSALGEIDYGIYNIVGGVVVLFSFLSNAMTSSTQRYINYNLGLGTKGRTNTVFNISLLVHVLLIFIVLFLAETIGLWFLVNHINIPQDRILAAHWVYQMSIVASLVNILTIPYRAAVIATEKMNIFASISVAEVVMKLLIVLMLPYIHYDSLILYSVLIALVSIANLYLYWNMSIKKISFTKYQFEWDKSLFSEIMIFFSFHLMGGMGMVGSKQGLNILINIFYNVTLNAAVGVANQVRGAVYGFISSFQIAFNPQIVQLYAAKDMNNLIILLFNSTKFSYYLLLILSLPVLLFCDKLLSIWLVEVPAYTVSFTRIIVISSFFEALSTPLSTVIGATGRIKRYQLFISLILLSDIPIAYMMLKITNVPLSVFYIDFVICFLAYLFRLLYARAFIGYSLKRYIIDVVKPCALVTIIAFPILYIMAIYQSYICSTIMLSVFSCIMTIIIIYLFGFSKLERNKMNCIILEKIRNI